MRPQYAILSLNENYKMEIPQNETQENLQLSKLYYLLGVYITKVLPNMLWETFHTIILLLFMIELQSSITNFHKL